MSEAQISDLHVSNVFYVNTGGKMYNSIITTNGLLDAVLFLDDVSLSVRGFT